jgi:hypothetical protein
MTVNGRRRLRLIFKFGLLVSLPLTGYLWALTGPSPWSIGLAAVCVVLALGAEGLVSVSEMKLSQLQGEADVEDRTFAAAIAARGEKIRQMDRTVDTLSSQNHDLRGKLVSLHGEVYRMHEETEHLNLDVPEETGLEPQRAEQPAADITAFPPLIKR